MANVLSTQPYCANADNADGERPPPPKAENRAGGVSDEPGYANVNSYTPLVPLNAGHPFVSMSMPIQPEQVNPPWQQNSWNWTHVGYSHQNSFPSMPATMLPIMSGPVYSPMHAIMMSQQPPFAVYQQASPMQGRRIVYLEPGAPIWPQNPMCTQAPVADEPVSSSTPKSPKYKTRQAKAYVYWLIPIHAGLCSLLTNVGASIVVNAKRSVRDSHRVTDATELELSARFPFVESSLGPKVLGNTLGHENDKLFAATSVITFDFILLSIVAFC